MNLPSIFNNNRREDNFFGPMTQLQKQIDQLFENFLPTSSSAWAMENQLPNCDVEEVQGHYVLSMDLPGVKKEDIKIELRNNVLTISGERKGQTEENKKNRYRSERFHGLFQRSFSLPEGISPGQIATEFKEGVLRIALPKAKEEGSHQIKIGEEKPGFFERLLGHAPKAAPEKREEKNKDQVA